MEPRHGITKLIGFCYGHRLMDYDGKCRHLHGHNGQLEVHLAAGELDNLGMVADFTDVKEMVGRWVDDNLDHRMLLHRDDPIAAVLAQHDEPVFLMAAHPTAENIAKLVFDQAQAAGLPVVEVRLWETPTSAASYRGSVA